MKEQTGDLKDLREKRFREINTDLKHLSELSFNELKFLYNELSASKKDYIKYMTKIEVKKDKWCRFIKYFIIALNTLILAGLIIEGTSLIEIFMGMSLISITCLDGYRKFRNIPEEIALDNYQSSLIKINDLILEKEKNMDKTLEVSLSKEVKEQTFNLNRDEEEQNLDKENLSHINSLCALFKTKYNKDISIPEMIYYLKDVMNFNDMQIYLLECEISGIKLNLNDKIKKLFELKTDEQILSIFSTLQNFDENNISTLKRNLTKEQNIMN